jgi:bacillithiol biosynthesis deacetylase BshB1
VTVDILAVGPHPDDVEMTCAGLLLKMKRKGYSTAAVHLTRGEMGSRGSPEEREKEAQAAARILELDHMEMLDLADGRVQASEQATRDLAQVLRQLRPRLLVAPFPRDPHPDHANAGLLAAGAAHLAELRKFPVAGAPHFVGQLVYATYRTNFTPSFVVDITGEFEAKKRAVLAYVSQVGPTREGEAETRLSSPHFLEAWEARHVYHGSLIGARYGEAYFTEYAVPLEDPVAAFAVPQQRRYAVVQLTPAGGPP